MAVSSAVLRALPAFSALDEQHMEMVSRVSALRAVPRGTVVLREGDRIDFIYFVVNGALKVQVADEDGREVILSILGPGELFGEMSVIDNHPRSATVVATQASDLVAIARQDFYQLLVGNIGIAMYLLNGLSQRLRQADRKIESLALMDVFGRVARLLLDMSENRDGKRVVMKKLSKQDIAKMVGASREMVSRVMTDLRQQGLIEEEDGRVILHGEFDL